MCRKLRTAHGVCLLQFRQLIVARALTAAPVRCSDWYGHLCHQPRVKFAQKVSTKRAILQTGYQLGRDVLDNLLRTLVLAYGLQ